jgi:hypothetical protein
MSVGSIGAGGPPPRTLLPRIADPLFQAGMAAFISGAARARMQRPTLAEILAMIRQGYSLRLDIMA